MRTIRDNPLARTTAVLLATALTVAGAPLVAAGHAYEQPVWFNWDTTDLDVLVLGIEDPAIGTLLQDAIHAWEVGLDDLDPDGLGSELNLRVHSPEDGTPPDGFEPDDIEIYFVPQGFYAINTGADACVANAPMAWWGGPLEPYGMKAYRTAAHEFGHCLGLDHVFNHGDEYSPSFDLLGSGSQHACPSNLNVQVLQRVFHGQGGEVTISSSDYVQADCPVPDTLFG